MNFDVWKEVSIGLC